ncbi:MAG TPA: serine/threonine-protein kinase [Kofleriaceae bacterium]|nr:serine/threonine-protein kinase [Kofleriaceae bacterium]
MGERSSSRGDTRAELEPLSADSRAFLQERLTLFGRWFALVAIAHYFIANTPTDLFLGYPFDWISEYFGPQEQLELAVTACAALVWVVARGTSRSVRILRVIDAAAIVVPMALLALLVHHATAAHGDLGEIAGVLLACTNVVVVRAVVVPSTARRTLVVSAVAWLPVVAVTVYALATSDGATRSDINMALATVMWAVVSTACAAIASRIVFRLRVEVAEAEALRLGQYTLQQKIGQGAMGVVYRAHHALLRRPTAIKMLAPDRNSATDLQRFENEVQHTARLTHPNTIAIYDFGRSREGTFYCAMELVDGPSLEEVVRQDGALPAWRVVHLLRQICGALAEAHAMGIIHRDIKPANLMLCERGGQLDTIKVLDFGLVRNLRDLETEHRVVGTPLYMAPEAFENPDGVDERCDLYSLGATAYFLLTGTPPFSGATTVAICANHLAQVPEPPSRRLGGPIAEDLERLVLRCLAKAPSDRPRARELGELLSECVDASGWSNERVAEWWRAHERPATGDSDRMNATGTLTVEPIATRDAS